MDRRVVFLFVLLLSDFTVGQCPATNSQPIITPRVICAVSPLPSLGPAWGVSYTCNDPSTIATWSSTILDGDLTVTSVAGPVTPSLLISGVNATEDHTMSGPCINSTLTFSGNNIAELDGHILTCQFTKITSISISLPSK